MKKLLFTIVILAGVLVFSQKPAHAQSELEIWCIAQVKIELEEEYEPK